MGKLGQEGQPIPQTEIKEIDFPVEFVDQIYGYGRIPNLVGMVIDGEEINFREHFARTIIGTYRDTAMNGGIEIPVTYPSIARVEETCNLREDEVLRGDLAYQITNKSYFMSGDYPQMEEFFQQLSHRYPYLKWTCDHDEKKNQWHHRVDSENFAMMVHQNRGPKLEHIRFTKVGFNYDMDFVKDTNTRVSLYAMFIKGMSQK